MNHSRDASPVASGATTLVRRLAAAAFLVALVAGPSACDAGLGVSAYPGGYYGDYPPDAYIATTEPVYFEGHASYWYGGRWYYRDGGRWGHYDREPAALYQRRSQGAFVRHSYEPNRGRAVGHVAAHGGGRR